MITGSLPQIIKLFLTSFINNGDAVASKYDSVEEEEKETGDEFSFFSAA